MVPSHAIFNTPLKVNLVFEDIPTPKDYLSPIWAGEEPLGTTIKVWKVQTRKFPEIDPGLVSNPYGFTDSPDAEIISSGINSKGPESVALARHGNYFLWGFSGAPHDMTPDARKAFINSVCYIKKFDGQRPIVRKAGSGNTRQGALWQARYLRHLFDEEAFKKDLPESIRNDPTRYAQQRAAFLKNATTSFPDEIRQAFGDDAEKYVAWTKENVEYLRFNGPGYDAKLIVDPDVKALGVSNRKIELLDRCVAELREGTNPERALRILKRYTNETFSDAPGWASWLEKNRDRLFFTEIGGFKWMVAPKTLIATSPRTTERPDAKQPVVASAELSPAHARLGDTVDLILRFETAPSWHIYAVGSSTGPGVATNVTLDLPEGIEADGGWSYPESSFSTDGQRIYAGSFEFRQRLRIKPGATLGPFEVACKLAYQACDPRSCRAPTKQTLKAAAEIAGK